MNSTQADLCVTRLLAVPASAAWEEFYELTLDDQRAVLDSLLYGRRAQELAILSLREAAVEYREEAQHARRECVRMQEKYDPQGGLV